MRGPVRCETGSKENFNLKKYIYIYNIYTHTQSEILNISTHTHIVQDYWNLKDLLISYRAITSILSSPDRMHLFVLLQISLIFMTSHVLQVKP